MVLISTADIQMFRRDAESLMVDTCIVYGPGTDPVFNDTTGEYEWPEAGILYPLAGQVGICKRQTAGARFELGVQSGGREVVESRSQLHLPASSPAIPSGSVAVVTAAPFEPSAVGQRLYVDGPAGGSLKTARRLNVTEVVA